MRAKKEVGLRMQGKWNAIGPKYERSGKPGGERRKKVSAQCDICEKNYRTAGIRDGNKKHVHEIDRSFFKYKDWNGEFSPKIHGCPEDSFKVNYDMYLHCSELKCHKHEDFVYHKVDFKPYFKENK
jgi:hypothetical protein